MLAVTEVNGCALCSYYHTRVSLENGMSAEEIKRMLGGEFADAPEAELSAILFAQHYADTRGKPSKEAWARILDVYGETGAYGVSCGDAHDHDGQRVRHRMGFVFQPFSRQSRPAQQPGIRNCELLCTISLVLAGMIHAGILRLIKKPVLTF